MATVTLPKTIENSIGMKFTLIPAGTFLMGSPPEEKQRSKDEEQHEVELTRPFYLGVFPVTQAQWRTVTGTNPSHFCATGAGKEDVQGIATDELPVEQVSWEDVTAFLERLAALEPERQAGHRYRLPTEAEWEYACRGGAAGYQVFYYGNVLSATQANYNGNYPYGVDRGPYLERTSAVGSYQPNGFGLYDMHGNVWEWCADWYDKGYYPNSPRSDPAGPSTGSDRVIRGGSWDCFGQRCRSAWRNGVAPTSRHEYLGCRAVLVASG
jgi:formylglycine-generating enzyme required for sulfatase activity